MSVPETRVPSNPEAASTSVPPVLADKLSWADGWPHWGREQPFTTQPDLIKTGESEKGPWALGSAPWGRDPQRSVLRLPAAPARGPPRASPFPRTLARLGPHLGSGLRTPDPQSRASPSPRFNYVIDFRLGRLETPLPPTGFNLPVPFLSLRVLLPGWAASQRPPWGASAGRAAASPFTPTKWSSGLGAPAARGSGLRSCLDCRGLHYSLPGSGRVE